MAGRSPESTASWADLGDDDGLDDYVLPAAYFSVGTPVEGQVVESDADGAYIGVGDALEAFLPHGEGGEGLRVGDEVDEVYVVGRDDETGRLRLGTSRKSGTASHASASASSVLLTTPAPAEERPGLVWMPFAREKARPVDPADEAEAERWRRPRLRGERREALAAAMPRQRTVSDDLRRSTQGLLGRLAPQNLRAVSEQLARIPIMALGELAFMAGAVLRRALARPPAEDVCAELAATLQGAWPALPGHRGGPPASFGSMLLDACRAKLWGRPGLPQHLCSQDVARWAEEQQRSLVLLGRFLGHLIEWQLLPALVAGAVAEDLLLGRGETAALPAEADAAAACGLLRAAGARLHAAPGGESRLRKLCQRLQQLWDVKRTNATPVNPRVHVYCEQVRNAMRDVLDCQAAGWPRPVDSQSSAPGAAQEIPEITDQTRSVTSVSGRVNFQDLELHPPEEKPLRTSVTLPVAEVATGPAVTEASRETAEIHSDDTDTDVLAKAASAEEVLAMLEQKSEAAVSALPAEGGKRPTPETVKGRSRKGTGSTRGRHKADKASGRPAEQRPWASLLQKMRHESAPPATASEASEQVLPLDADTQAPTATAEDSELERAVPLQQAASTAVVVASDPSPAAVTGKHVESEDDDSEWAQICADAEAAAADEEGGSDFPTDTSCRASSSAAGSPVIADCATTAEGSPDAPGEAVQKPRRRWNRAARVPVSTPPAG